MDVKEFILNNITMLDILDKYGIKRKGYMFHCQFHGQDKHKSAKAYSNSYYCFTCNSTGDVISFVEKYFNLSFREAMQKINIDFGLNLSLNQKIDKSKISKIKEAREKKEQIKKELIKKFGQLCDKRYKIIKEISKIQAEINIINWEEKVQKQAKLLDKLYILDEEIDEFELKNF